MHRTPQWLYIRNRATADGYSAIRPSESNYARTASKWSLTRWTQTSPGTASHTQATVAAVKLISSADPARNLRQDTLRGPQRRKRRSRHDPCSPSADWAAGPDAVWPVLSVSTAGLLSSRFTGKRRRRHEDIARVDESSTGTPCHRPNESTRLFPQPRLVHAVERPKTPTYGFAPGILANGLGRRESVLNAPVDSAAALAVQVAGFEQLSTERRAIEVMPTKDAVYLSLRVLDPRLEFPLQPPENDVALLPSRRNPDQPLPIEKRVENFLFPIHPFCHHVAILAVQTSVFRAEPLPYRLALASNFPMLGSRSSPFIPVRSPLAPLPMTWKNASLQAFTSLPSTVHTLLTRLAYRRYGRQTYLLASLPPGREAPQGASASL